MAIGVITSTLTRTGPTNPTGPSSARFIVPGICAQGPTDRPVTLRSIGDFVDVFGDRSTVGALVFDAVQSYFAEGGTEAVVCRVVGPAAVASSLNVSDRAGAPQPTIKISANSQGNWGDALQVQILDGAVTNSVTLRVIKAGLIVETFADLVGPAAVAAAAAASNYIRVTTLGSTTTDPAQARPAVTAVTNLAGGSDDRAAVTKVHILAALNTLCPLSFGPGAVAAPGYDVTTIGADLIAHAKATGRVALLATVRTADKTAAISAATNGLADGDYAGVFWPWVTAPEGADTKVIPPEGYVAGVRARALSEVGVWQAPPGDRASARFITGTVTPVDQALNSELDLGRVNGIVTYAGKTFLYNYRSLSTNEAQFKLLSSRDTLNAIVAQVSQVLLPTVWSTIDGTGTTQAIIDGLVRGVLQPIADAGGLYANPPTYNDAGSITDEGDEGYSVEVTATPVQLADNTIAVNVGVRLSPFAALILVRITKSNLTAPV